MITASGMIKVNDDELDRLADYYRTTEVRKTTALTFEQFLNLYLRGRWYERVV